MNSKWNGRTLGVGIVGVGLVAMISATALPSREADRTVQAFAAEPGFTTLSQLVSASDLIVVGRAVSETPGPSYGDADDTEDALGSHRVALETYAPLWGTKSPGPVVLEELTTDGGQPLVVNGLAPTATSDFGLFFLERVGGESPTYILVSGAGRYLLSPDGRVYGFNPESPLAVESARNGFAALVAATRVATRSATAPSTVP